MKPSVLFILLALLLSACGKENSTANKPTGQLYEKEIETLNQAKQLQKQLNEQTEQTKQRMDELNKQ